LLRWRGKSEAEEQSEATIETEEFDQGVGRGHMQDRRT
jgi:hypothetical protein